MESSDGKSIAQDLVIFLRCIFFEKQVIPSISKGGFLDLPILLGDSWC